MNIIFQVMLSSREYYQVEISICEEKFFFFFLNYNHKLLESHVNSLVINFEKHSVETSGIKKVFNTKFKYYKHNI